MSALEELALWEVLKEKADDKQRQMVRDAVSRASNLLDLIRDTFPTYTLHNHIHAENVAALMGNLLGDKIKEITPLESAILILSAYYHDIGMVFREEERNKLADEPSFNDFKKHFPEALVRIHKNDGEIPLDIAEWYCRWVHPDRVQLFLNGLKMNWNNMPLNRELGLICRSHGFNSKRLQDDDEFPTDFLYSADLKFCAIILRLADILDFDNSRSPEEVYQYLGIQRREDKRTEMSDVEWRKHLSTGGFIFPKTRKERYELGFVAAPSEPAVEYDIREFLGVIEDEFNKCISLLRYCSERWNNFPLPNRIARQNIRSKNYWYGEYRFTLEQNQILDLLMGEKLYDNSYVFIRELLQNAIDTTRHRQFFEEARSNKSYKPKIVVSQWHDDENYRWIRIDDNGMGMDKFKIKNYLLKVGKCYYTSSDFEAEKLNYRHPAGKDFTPISRFGIGLLSCFIAGDRVEISTNPAQGDDSFRLSLPTLHGFYVLQSKEAPHAPKEMPSANNDERSFRKSPGTSIAVRLAPRLEGHKFNLKSFLGECVFCPPVPIEFEGEQIGGASFIIEKPMLKRVIEAKLNKGEMEEIESVLNYKFSEKIRVKIIPLDLTQNSPTLNLKGQIVVLLLKIAETDTKRLINKFRARTIFQITRVSYSSLQVLGVPVEIISKLQSIEEVKYTTKAGFINALEKVIGEDQIIKYKFRILRHAESLDFPYHNTDLHISSIEFNREQLINPLIVRYEKELKNHKKIERREEISLARFLNELPEAIKPRLVDCRHHWLSHNGLFLPTKCVDSLSFSLLNEYEFKLSADFLNKDFEQIAWLKGILTLSDSLRPDVSVGRDQLRGLSWNISSAITLAFSRAVRAYREDIFSMNIFERGFFKNEGFLLGTILKDPYIGVAKEWSCEPIIETSCGKMSLEDIKSELKQGSTFEIPVDYLIRYRTSYYTNFIDHCIGALIQIGLKLYLRIEKISYFNLTDQSLAKIEQDNIPPNFLNELERMRDLCFESKEEFAIALEETIGEEQLKPYRSTILKHAKQDQFKARCLVSEPDDPMIIAGQKLFSPLFFIAYENSDLLRYNNCPLNQRHPFAAWLIENSQLLHKKYPGIFQLIKNTISKGINWSHEWEDIKTEVNKALKRIRQLEPELLLEQDVILKDIDFDR